MNIGHMRERDTTVFILEMSTILRVARFTSTLWLSYDLHEIWRTQEEALLERKYFTGSMPFLTPIHSFETCGDPKASTSTTIFRKCGGRTS